VTYGKWSVQTSKQAPSKHTQMHVQCSRASVGLIQARPNYSLHGLITLLC